MDFAAKKILVTGAGGFLGSHIVDQLIAIGVPRRNVSIPRSKDADLRVMKNCEAAVRGQTIIVHAAALTGNIEFHMTNPGKIFYDNAIMGMQLIEAARQSGVEKFITIGSATEYPQNAAIPFVEKDLWNGFPERSHRPYSLAKKCFLSKRQPIGSNMGFTQSIFY